MCTAVTYKTKHHYFGRNLDLEYSYDESVVITPRNYPFKFRREDVIANHYAMIGMAYVVEDYPLYYDATNEKGLSMAGLSFEGNAKYKEGTWGKYSIASFEFIPWILSKCATVDEAAWLIKNTVITCEAFSEDLPPSPLHWIIADKDKSITVEYVKDGVKIYDNPVGVLTNNPEFPYHMMNLNNFMALSNEPVRNDFSDKIKLTAYSRGMGAMGLPGDLSSASRFVKAAFTKTNSVSGEGEKESVNQFFHILTSVEQQRGLVKLPGEKYEITVYSSCCNTDKGIYYYTTYENRKINKVEMRKENLDGNKIVLQPLEKNDKSIFHM